MRYDVLKDRHILFLWTSRSVYVFWFCRGWELSLAIMGSIYVHRIQDALFKYARFT